MTKKSRSFCLKLSLNVLSFYILGCSSSNQKELTYFDIPKEVQSNFALSEIAESINYIALETTEDSFLSLIQNVLFSNDKLFAVDLSGKILVFDLNGKFLYQIGSQGEGPGQFFYLSSIVIDERSGLLHIASGRRIITYTLDNQYIGEKSFPFFIDYLEIIDNQLVMIAGQDGKKMGSKFVNQRSLFKVSTELDVVDSIPLLYIEMNEETGATFPFKNYISQIDEDNFIYIPVLINEPIVRDTLFKINESYLSPLFKLNFTPPLFDKEGNKLILIKNIFISRKFIFCEYNREGNGSFYIGSRDTDFSINLDEGILTENGENVVLRPLDLKNDQFYFINTSSFSNTSSEELNPVIGIVTLK
jgi:hypothetical protein